MSKRHQSSRRRTYGRRQHELRERSDRRWLPSEAEPEAEEHRLELFRRVGLGGPRLAFGHE
ncbi:MAG TPA: hypothetical protein VF763_02370 [Candidatus Limnocylindrales bacterium]